MEAILLALVLSAFQFQAPGPSAIALAPSPNFGMRPPGVVIDTIVLHHTAGPTLEGVVSWFGTRRSRVSSQYSVGKDGSIVQHVSNWDRSWHAGVSRDALGRGDLNRFSIGIEMVNVGDGSDLWTEPQVIAVHDLCAVLVKWFPIRQITSHRYIALPAGRKNDPLGFPWERMADLGVELVP